MKTLQNDKRKTAHVPKLHVSQRIEEMKIQLPVFYTSAQDENNHIR
jgi:hypothetical protein